MGLGYGIRKKPITDPWSRGQKGTDIRIRNTATKYFFTNSEKIICCRRIQECVHAWQLVDDDDDLVTFMACAIAFCDLSVCILSETAWMLARISMNFFT